MVVISKLPGKASVSVACRSSVPIVMVIVPVEVSFFALQMESFPAVVMEKLLNLILLFMVSQ